MKDELKTFYIGGERGELLLDNIITKCKLHGYYDTIRKVDFQRVKSVGDARIELNKLDRDEWPKAIIVHRSVAETNTSKIYSEYTEIYDIRADFPNISVIGITGESIGHKEAKKAFDKYFIGQMSAIELVKYLSKLM